MKLYEVHGSETRIMVSFTRSIFKGYWSTTSATMILQRRQCHCVAEKDLVTSVTDNFFVSWWQKVTLKAICRYYRLGHRITKSMALGAYNMYNNSITILDQKPRITPCNFTSSTSHSIHHYNFLSLSFHHSILKKVELMGNQNHIPDYTSLIHCYWK